MTATGEESARDPGLQPERTRLAWRRTTLACTVVAVLAVKQTLHGSGSVVELAGVSLVALVWIGFLAMAHRRILELSTARPPSLDAVSARLVALCVLALAFLAVLLIL
ncbi:DUF202 domain-containing protein [Streptomyces sp. NPDC006879]|uniref:DUF202 domain-containing protein n=1 Tax=Streptomyces sp. NPDC006879 TaxID=3364767 RepID=UPI0036831464